VPKLEEQPKEKATRKAKKEMENNFMFKRGLLFFEKYASTVPQYIYVPTFGW
jgi:hypothetical protein